jgi:SAM-dependent methyltransferase
MLADTPVSLVRDRWVRFVTGAQRIELAPEKDVLDVGCGRLKHPGAVGLDQLPNTDADIVHDLDETPYPLQSDSFDLVIARHVLEHVAAPLDVLAEIHRVLRPGGVVIIITPHFSSSTSWTDPTHRHHFTSRSFDYLTEGGAWSYYNEAVRYDIVDRCVTLGMVTGPGGRVVPVWRLLGVEQIVNHFLDVFERWWAMALPLGPKDLVVRMQVVK